MSKENFSILLQLTENFPPSFLRLEQTTQQVISKSLTHFWLEPSPSSPVHQSSKVFDYLFSFRSVIYYKKEKALKIFEATNLTHKPLLSFNITCGTLLLKAAGQYLSIEKTLEKWSSRQKRFTAAEHYIQKLGIVCDDITKTPGISFWELRLKIFRDLACSYKVHHGVIEIHIRKCGEAPRLYWSSRKKHCMRVSAAGVSSKEWTSSLALSLQEIKKWEPSVREKYLEKILL